MKKNLCVIAAALLAMVLVSGCVSAVDEPVVRRQFIATVNEVFHFHVAMGSEERFTDIEIGTLDYYTFAIAQKAGYLNGYLDGTAEPDKAVTRAEAAAVLNQVLQLSDPDNQYDFTDSDDIPEWAADSVQCVVGQDIMTVSEDGGFNPNKALSQKDLNHIVEAVKGLGLNQRQDTLMNIASFDGYDIKGRLSMPSGNGAVDKLVVFVHGTGPNTYLMHRQNDSVGVTFNFLDFYADGFTKDGTAFFSYSTRGVSPGDKPYTLVGVTIDYINIDEDEYRGYTPRNIAHDLKYMIEALKSEPRLKDAVVILLGMSEGTVIAPLAVSEYGAEADVLLLAGYSNENMKDVLDYQLGGGMSYFNTTVYLNVVGTEKISKEQFLADPYGVIGVLFQGATFEQIDVTGDGFLSVEDFAVLNSPVRDALFQAVDRGDDEWIKSNMSSMMPPLPTDWFLASFALPKTEEIMVNVDIPIFIFHGTYDANCPVQGAYDVRERFESLGKANLTVNIYEGYDHELNFSQWVLGLGSQAVDDIFETVRSFNASR